MVLGKTETKKASYPMFSASSWWTLRKQFMRRMPGKVDQDYLAGSLKMELRSTIKLIAPLKKMGLIDEEGKPTERALRWRDDDQYPSVCKEIQEDIYPPELMDTFPDPHTSRSVIEKWFANRTGVGIKTSESMAALYLLLSEADPAKQDAGTQGKTPNNGNSKGTPVSQNGNSPRRGKKALAKVSVASETVVEEKFTPPPRHVNGFEPAIHINIQVHISPEASGDQIDHIFKSMAKYLLNPGKKETE